jgi:hypothetical protein
VISGTIHDDSTGDSEKASDSQGQPSEPTANDGGAPPSSNGSAGAIPCISVIEDSYVPCGRLDRPDAAWVHKTCRDMPRSPLNSLAGSKAEHAVLTLKGKLWGSGGQHRTLLKYFFIGGNEAQKTKVRAAIATWELYAFVDFKEQHSAENTQIRIEFNGNAGSWSYVRTRSVNNTIL